MATLSRLRTVEIARRITQVAVYLASLFAQGMVQWPDAGSEECVGEGGGILRLARLVVD